MVKTQYHLSGETTAAVSSLVIEKNKILEERREIANTISRRVDIPDGCSGFSSLWGMVVAIPFLHIMKKLISKIKIEWCPILNFYVLYFQLVDSTFYNNYNNYEVLPSTVGWLLSNLGVQAQFT